MEDLKIKISVLWLFASIAFLAHQIIVLMEPGVIAQLMAGIAEGQEISPGMILFFAILMLVPMMMSFLSLFLRVAESLVKYHRGHGLYCPMFN